MRPAVFDATALVALLRGHKKVYEIWTDASQAGDIAAAHATAEAVATDGWRTPPTA